MEDYQGNSNKNKQSDASEEKQKPKKVVTKVTVGEVIVPKKSISKKFRELFGFKAIFGETDTRSVAEYVIVDVMVPAARNLIFDVLSEGLKRKMYGDSATRRYIPGSGSRVTSYTPYNRPIERRYSPLTGAAVRRPINEPRAKHERENFILSSRQEAELVLERMNDIIDSYEVVSVADLNELVGLPTSHIDNKWGWTYVGDVDIRQVREGYLIDFPLPEPIS